MKNQFSILLSLFVLVGIFSAAVATSHADEPLNFSRDIRPILSNKCFACHGPDSQNRDADFHLDTAEGAFADLGGYAGIVPGKPDDSELVNRITNEDDDLRMPPVKHKNPLTEKEIELLKRWIAEGAPYAGHWAFQPVQRPEPPKTALTKTTVIDQFIASRLEAKGLKFSPEAAPETLVRRLYLDLTGLPPTLAEVDAFVKNPEAEFEPTIDRLMASPAFAERLAMEWLDVARFADTNGYSIDDHRDMWAWRDWVIQAFQNNKPYDEFIREQIAGDLIENATESQRIATGFLRNSMNTHEGGTIEEEYRVAAINDKVDTVATAFLGLTMRCAQCHDHKYDPLSQKDYYRFFAFFNTSSESGKGGTNGNANPMMTVSPLLQDEAAFRQMLESRIDSLQSAKAYPEPLLGDVRLKWEEATLAVAPRIEVAGKNANTAANTDATKNAVATPFRIPTVGEADGLAWIWSNPVGSGQFAWFRKIFELEKVPPRAQLMVSCDNEAEIWVNGKRLGFNPDWRTPTVFDLQPLLIEGENLIAIAGKDWEKEGGKAALLALVSFSDGRYLVSDATWTVSSEIDSAKQPNWNQRGAAAGFQPAAVVARHGAAPWGNVFPKIGVAGEVSAVNVSSSPTTESPLIAALRKPDSERSRDEQNLVAAEFSKVNSDMKKLVHSIDGEIALLRKSIASGKTSVMVMDEAKADRKTPLLERGQYDQHREIVEAGVPEIFGGLPDSTSSGSSRHNRLALADWLIDPQHPLTARVAVNRYWQLLYGTGLVKTSEDFGSQGEWPSHPELLDWLAAEFVESNWDLRALLKTMIMTQTYRQASDVSEELLEVDPYNRLFARAPRYRLSAEAVRDSELAIAGLLNQQIGGPSVFPPQPLGLWKEVSHFGYGGFFSAQHDFPDRDRQVYRRSMYTFWKRTSPPPMMTAFDAPNRETCVVRRSLTNTPLQALVLMNAPQFVEASRGLAMKMLSVGEAVDEQIRIGFRLATAREPSAKEMEILTAAYQRQLGYFESSQEKAAAYLGGAVVAANNEQQNPGSDSQFAANPQFAPNLRFAAMSSVASLILNLDETITRE